MCFLQFLQKELVRRWPRPTNWYEKLRSAKQCSQRFDSRPPDIIVGMLHSVRLILKSDNAFLKASIYYSLNEALTRCAPDLSISKLSRFADKVHSYSPEKESLGARRQCLVLPQVIECILDRLQWCSNSRAPLLLACDIQK